MSNFMKGFNAGFTPYVGNIADLISNTMYRNSRQDKQFYNDMALQNNQRIADQEKLRMKLEDEQRKIAEQKQYHAKNQSIVDSLLKQYDENAYAQLPDEYQNKYNRIIRNREEPEMESISRDDFIDAGKVPGLSHLKGYQVKRTQKFKGSNLVDLSYGQPFKKEDTERPQGTNKGEDLSKVEKDLLKSVEERLLQQEVTLSKAQTYGATTLPDDDTPYSVGELKEQFKSEKEGMIESVKVLLGKEKLKPYRESFNKYRKQGDIALNPQQLSDKDFASYTTDLVTNIEESYKNGEISEADLDIYQMFLRLELGLSLRDIKGIMNAR